MSPSETATVVLITGEPGSGKTTLGRELSGALRVPFIARDDVRGGLFYTAGAWTDEPRRVPASADAVEAFLQIVEVTAGLGVSCVVEYVVREDRPQDLERLLAVGSCVVLFTWCRDAIERFVEREQADRLLNRQAVLDALGCSSVDEHTTGAVERMRAVGLEMRTDFDLPLLRVNTDDGYDPGLDTIIDFVTRAAG